MGMGSTGMNLRKEKARELVAQMTLEEKAGLCSGKDQWRLKEIERLGLNTVMVSDGPHGLRKQLGTQDNLGIGDSVPSVCFPTASALACSFDRELAYEVGKAIGEECLQEGVSVVLGPGVNLKRSPLCGRNFEYYSEDPILSGEMAVGMIQGVQSQGIGTSLKHFAVNNQEKRRMTVSAVVDERAFRETYLKAFEIAVKKGKPRTVMCAYNRMNGEYCSENINLLTEILRKEWGYEGLVLSDWGAVNDRVLGVKAGMDLEMPGSRGINDAKIVAAVKNNTLAEQDLDKVACRITELILEGMASRQEGYHYDVNKHHQLAVRAEEQSAVLLKNKDNILPGNVGQKAAVIGVFAKEPRYQGAGSSKIHPIQVNNTWDALVKSGMNVSYAQGYSIGKDKELEAAFIKEACDVAKGKDVVYVFAGLPEGYESEGFDRTNLSLPESQNRLIAAVAESNPEVVVILFGGAPMELPWEDKVKGILLAYLGGEGVGKAIAKLLLGKAVPSGKLAETWPVHLSDNPSYSYFPGGRKTVEYRESIYIGYRYYEKAGKPVRYPFGHGLSYASFAYSELQIDQEECNYGDKIEVTFQITNLGTVTAKETALIFVSHQNDKVFLPVKELREFIKVSLQPGESKPISVELDTKSFAYYNNIIHDWYAESGDYKIMVGSSSAECPLEGVIHLNSTEQPQPDFRECAPSYYRLSNQEFAIPQHEFSNLYGGLLPEQDHKPSRPYDHDNTLEDVSHTLLGKLILKVADRMSRKVTKASQEEEGMMSSMIKEMPFHSLVTSSDGIITEPLMEGIIEFLNGHYLKGLHKLIQKK
jgi:beta-glucosidase